MQEGRVGQAIEGAARITEQASGLGGEIFVVTLVLLIVVVYVFLVVVPDARSRRTSNERLVEAVSLLSGHVAGASANAEGAHRHAAKTADHTGALVAAGLAQASVLEKLNAAGPKLPIQAELGEIRGALRAAT